MPGGHDDFQDLSINERRLYATEKDVQQIQRTQDVLLNRVTTLEDNVKAIDAKLNRIMYGVFAAAFGLLGQLLLQYISDIGAHAGK